MKTLQLDQFNNIIIENGNLCFIEGLPAVAQNIKNSISLVRQENPFNIKDGIDYFNPSLNKMGGIAFISSQIKEKIKQNKNVLEILDFNISKEGTSLVINIKTKYGDVFL